MRCIYLDYAATTPTHPDVVAAMQPYFSETFGNPMSLYAGGRRAQEALDASRHTVAQALGAAPEEIVFTSGGSESDNYAIKGVAYALREKGNHIITTTIEHHAVLEPCHFLQHEGFEVTCVPVDTYGMVDPDDVEKAITNKTTLVSVMHANNEIGTIEPIEEIGSICRKKGVCMHTDAVQSFGALDVNVNRMNVDLLTLSAHKFYGPKGVGVLYIRKGTKIVPLIHGGGQESNRRASTHNVPGIVGCAKAVALTIEERNERVQHARRLRDKLVHAIQENVKDVRFNGHPECRLPNNCHILVKYVEGESMLLKLDALGIEAATGSACSSGSLEPSHVLIALGISREDVHGSLRMTVGRLTTEQDIDYFTDVFPGIVAELRKMSPMTR
jgi:cysteine desulfurase